VGPTTYLAGWPRRTSVEDDQWKRPEAVPHHRHVVGCFWCCSWWDVLKYCRMTRPWCRRRNDPRRVTWCTWCCRYERLAAYRLAARQMATCAPVSYRCVPLRLAQIAARSRNVVDPGLRLAVTAPIRLTDQTMGVPMSCRGVDDVATVRAVLNSSTPGYWMLDEGCWLAVLPDRGPGTVELGQQEPPSSRPASEAGTGRRILSRPADQFEAEASPYGPVARDAGG